MGIDGCGAVSVTTPGVFQRTKQCHNTWGEEYSAATKSKLQTVGQHTAQSFTNEHISTSTQYRFTEPPVHRPLTAICEVEDVDKTLCSSKVFGRWIYDYKIRIATDNGMDNYTYYRGQWFFLGRRIR